MKFLVRDLVTGEVKWSLDTFTDAYHAWRYEIAQTSANDHEIVMGE